MALQQTLEEQLTCPVCQDIYTDPMVLKCHHSLCAECLQGLKHASRVRWKVECPVCREECDTNIIQRDFRTITLLEAHAKAKDATPSLPKAEEPRDICSTTGFRLCDSCRKDPVRQMCKDCDKLFCQTCSKNHKSLPACKDHSLNGLNEKVGREKSSLAQELSHLKQQDTIIEKKQHDIDKYKQELGNIKEKALHDLNQWYDDFVARATEQRDSLANKINNCIDSNMAGVAEKELIVSEKQTQVKQSLEMIQEIQIEEDPAKVLGTVDELRNKLENRKLEDSPYDVKDIVIPRVPDVKVYTGKKWDEGKAIHVSIKKTSAMHRQIPWAVTFPSTISTMPFVKQKDVDVKKGSKQVLYHHGHLWCLYDDHIDIYDNNDKLIKTVSSHVAIPNGVAGLRNGNVIVACMSHGLIEFTAKGKFVSVITEGNMCDVSVDHKFVYSLDYANNKPYMKTFRKKHFRWKMVIDTEIQNDKCNTFNTILASQSSVFISATEDNVLLEYSKNGDMVSRITGPKATRLCCSDTWGNILLTNHERNEVWLFKTDQTWHRLTIQGLNKPYGVAMDEDGGLWVSNPLPVLSRFVCQSQTIR